MATISSSGKTGCTGIRTGDQLLVEAEFAIREALVRKFNDRADLGVASLQDGVKAQLHNKNINWEHVLDSTILGEDYGDVEELIAAVEARRFERQPRLSLR